ncbi:MAG: hypothetical protein ACI31R_00530 [Bacilli bacterium]
MKDEKKSCTGLIVLVVILSVLLLGAVGYICYDKLNAEETCKPEETLSITEEEVDKLVEMVPFDKRELAPSKTYADAYTNSENETTIENVDKQVYSSYAINLISDDKFLPYSKGLPVDDQYKDLSEEEIKEIGGETMYLEKDVLVDTLKTLYYVDDEDLVDGDMATRSQNNSIYKLLDNYYVDIGTSSYDNQFYKYSKVVEYKAESNDELIVTEKVGFLIYGLNGFYLTNSRDSKDYIYSCSNDCDDSITKEKVKENYFDNNLDKFNTYQHTFKKTDGAYHWYSTKLVK